MSRQLQEVADKAKAQDIALAYLSPKDGAEKAYKVNLAPDVKNTVMLYRDRTVTAKYVNFVADEKGLKALRADVAKLVK